MLILRYQFLWCNEWWNKSWIIIIFHSFANSGKNFTVINRWHCWWTVLPNQCTWTEIFELAASGQLVCTILYVHTEWYLSNILLGCLPLLFFFFNGILKIRRIPNFFIKQWSCVACWGRISVSKFLIFLILLLVK